jgi:class 3 adenylate cyclase
LGGLERRVNQFGGSVVHVAGDALICLFKHKPGESPGSASLLERASACASSMLSDFESVYSVEEPSLSIHGGAAVGKANLIHFGSDETGMFTMNGEALDSAVRMLATAARGHFSLQDVTSGQTISLPMRSNANKRLQVIPSTPTPPRRSVDESEALGFLSRYVPDFFRQMTGEREAMMAGGIYIGASIFVNLCDFTVAEDLSFANLQRLSGAFVVMSLEVKSAGGLVDVLLCDDKGFVFKAVFGVFGYYEDAEFRAVSCALRIRERLEELSVNGKIGVSAGRLFAGAVNGGSGQWCGFTMLGSQGVTLAARLMCSACPGEVCACIYHILF